MRLHSMHIHILFPAFLGLALLAAATPATVYIIRHGEKPQNKHDHGLNLDGIKRSLCLREIFGDLSDYHIGHIMAPAVKRSKSSKCFHIFRVFCTIPPNSLSIYAFSIPSTESTIGNAMQLLRTSIQLSHSTTNISNPSLNFIPL